MADYLAVLTRTLSGFTDAKPTLREKLYERARGTIRKQLDMRNPALEEAEIEAEMAKLEAAIDEIEGQYQVTGGDSAPDATAPPPSATPEPQAPSTQPSPAGADPAPKLPKVGDGSLEPSPDVSGATGGAVAQPADAPVFDSAKANIPAGAKPEPQAGDALAPSEAPPIPSTFPKTDADKGASYSGLPAAEIREDLSLSQMTSSPVGGIDPAAGDPADPVIEAQEPQKPLDGMSEAEAKLDAWKTEFLTEEPALASATAEDGPVSDPSAIGAMQSSPQFGVDDTPRARRAARLTRVDRSGSNVGLTVVIAVLVLVVLALVAFLAVPQLKPMRNATIESLGLTDMLGSVLDLDDPAAPTPVRTITIAPPETESEPASDPASEPAAQPANEPAPEPAPQSAPSSDGPKGEDRLGEDGAPAAAPTPLPGATAPQGGSDQGATSIEDQTDAAAATAPVVQLADGESSAILWEEGSTPGSAVMIPGSIVWSLGSESLAEGLPEEPVISGRLTVPDRSLILLLSIKRNVDEALPASHLIELVFAVPDDFPGGTISNINRFALKESEQARGENLIGVPARLDDGIFLIALNNLEESRQRNVNLMRTLNWIDIPLEYRTGRRALVAMEKGAAGQQVFTDALAAWDNLN